MIEAASSRCGVRASAGSGKTYQLTTFFLRSLLSGTAPGAMLATTFTRKAAGEILGRVVTRLCDACDDKDKFQTLVQDLGITGIDQSQAQELLLTFCRSLHEVRISTIDSFFGQLLRSYCYDLGVAPDVRIMEKGAPEIERIRLDAVRSVLVSHDRQTMLELLNDLAGDKAERSVVASLLVALDYAHEKFGLAPAEAWEPEYFVPNELLPNELAAVFQTLDLLAEAVDNQRLSKSVRDDVARARSGNWEQFLSRGVAAKVAAGDCTFYSKSLPDEIVLPYQALVNHARGVLLSRHVNRTRALHTALSLYHQHFCERLRCERILLFSDVPRLLSQLIGNQHADEVSHRIDSDLKCLLLDEFQDTSPQQYSILSPFAQRITELPDESGRIFCVGDTKQSIYGWRGGTSRLFKRIGDDFALQWSDSNISYRSSQFVLDAVNAVFENLSQNAAIPGEWKRVANAWQSTFQRHEAFQSHFDGYVEVLQSEVQAGDESAEITTDEDTELVFDAHLDFAAQRIRKLTQQSPQHTIGVLLRSNDAARSMLYLLERHGVKATSEGGESIADDAAVAIILSALHFAEHPGDTAALCHLLNSPLRDEFALDGDFGSAAGVAARNVRHAIASDGLDVVIERWAKKLAPQCDERSTQRLSQLLEMTDVLQSQPVTSAAEFIERVRNQAMEISTPATVRVMTIHKAKGLEFDIVVLPELHKKILKEDVLLWTRDEQSQEINRICAWPAKTIRELQPELEAMYQEYAREQINEAFCTLYVAMTRARQALHLIVPSLKKKKDGTAGSTPFTFASMIRAGLCGAQSLEDVDTSGVLCTAGNAAWCKQDVPNVHPTASQLQPRGREYLAFDPDERLPRIHRRITPLSLQHTARNGVSQLLEIEDHIAARRRAVLHHLISRCLWNSEAAVEDAELHEHARRACRGVTNEEADTFVAEFRTLQPALNGYFQMPQVEDKEEVELWIDRPFATIVDGTLINGKFDRVVVVRDASKQPLRAQLLEFKFGRNDEESCRAQIAAYRDALCQMLALGSDQVEARLVFIDSGRSVEI